MLIKPPTIASKDSTDDGPRLFLRPLSELDCMTSEVSTEMDSVANLNLAYQCYSQFCVCSTLLSIGHLGAQLALYSGYRTIRLDLIND